MATETRKSGFLSVMHWAGRSFLEHLAREYGWTVRYEDAQLARDASGIILHGSVVGLSPEDSLAVAVRTSGLSLSVRNGEVAVSRGAGRR